MDFCDFKTPRLSYVFTSDSVWSRGHPVLSTASVHGTWGGGPGAQTSPCPEKACVLSSVLCPTPKDVCGARNSSRGQGEGLYLQVPGYVDRAPTVCDILEDVKASGIYREHTRYTCVHRLCAPPPRRVGGRRGATAHRAASVLTQLPACVHGQVSTSGGSGRALTPQKPRKHVRNEEGTRGGHGLPPWQAHGI